jgi:hypothetical protein
VEKNVEKPPFSPCLPSPIAVARDFPKGESEFQAEKRVLFDDSSDESQV